MVLPRVKKFHSKVRSGCITCKKRRVKCDEERPFCRRCLSAVRQCEGYFDDRPFHSPQLDENKPLQLAYGVPVLQGAFDDADSVRSFEFFVENAVPTFCAYFGHDFWARLFPQASFENPILRHSLIATAALIEKLEYDTDRNQAAQVYQQHYHKALLLASSPSYASQIHTILMACLMFACCSFMQCSVNAGYQHILSGMKIIAEQYGPHGAVEEEARGGVDQFVISSIAPLFASYAMKAPAYGYPLAWPKNYPDMSGLIESGRITATFRSINHVRHCLDGIAHLLLRDPETVDRADHVSDKEITHMLQKWEHTLEAYLKGLRPNEFDKIRDSCLLLRAHHIVLQAMLVEQSKPASTRNLLEQFTPRFQQLNRFVRNLLQHASSSGLDPNVAAYFSLTGQLSSHLGFIPPLYYTATKCVDFSTRLEAISILKQLRIVERAWTSCVAGTIAEHVLALEYGPNPSKDWLRPTSQTASVTVKSVNLTPPATNFSSLTAHFAYETTPLSDRSQLLSEKSNTIPAVTVFSSLEMPNCGCARLCHWPLDQIFRKAGYQGSNVAQPCKCLTGD